MDSVRLIYVIAIQTLTMIGGTSPTNGREHENVDPVPIGGDRRGQFAQIAFGTILINVCGAYHLYYHSSDTVGILENLLFFGFLSMFSLRMYCYWVLGHFFTFSLLIKKGHQLITTGPYQYLVHPSYTAQIGCCLLGLLFLRSYLVMVPMIPYALVVVLKRAKMEENMLRLHFGDQFDKYMSVRNRFIPGVY